MIKRWARLYGWALLFIFAGAVSGISTVEAPIDRDAAQAVEAAAKEATMEWSRASRQNAANQFRQAAEQWEQSGEAARAAECLRQASRQYAILSDEVTGKALLLQALGLEPASAAPAGRSQTLSLLALVSLRTGLIVEGERLADEASALSIIVDDARSRAMSAFSSAEYHYYKRDYPNALKRHQDSIRHWQTAGDRREEADVLVSYAYALLGAQDPFRSLSTARDAAAIFEELGDQRGVSLASIALGHTFSVIDDKQMALQAYQKASANFPRDLDGIELGRLNNGLGLIYEDHGDWEASLKFRRDAFGCYRREGYPNGQLSTLPSLIYLSHRTGDRGSVLTYFEIARQLSESLGDDVLLAVAKSYVANHLYETGSYAEAELLFDESVKVLEEKGVDHHAALTKANLAKLSLHQGNTGRAQSLLTESLALYRRLQSRFGEAQTLYDLARLYSSLGKDSEALSTITQSVAVTDKLYSDISLSDLQSKYYSGNYSRYALLIDLMMEGRSAENADGQNRLAFEALEKARARITLETILIAGSDSALQLSPESAEREKNLRTLLNLKLDAVTEALSRNESAVVQSLENEITGLRVELDVLKAELATRNPAYAAIKEPPPFDLSAFQRNVLDDESLLLEYFLGDERSYLWIIGKNEFASFVLPPRQAIEATVNELETLLNARRLLPGETYQHTQSRIAQADSSYTIRAKELSRQILGPVGDRLDGKRLIIVPDGRLHGLSFSALPLPNGDSADPILLTNEVTYQPSAQALALLTSLRSESSVEVPRDVLVFSDPVFSRGDDRLTGQHIGNAGRAPDELNLRFAASLEGLQRLPGSGQEADTIRNIVNDTDVFSGFLATRDRLLAVPLSDYKVIHIATHGMVNESRSELSALVLSRFDSEGRPIDESVRLRDIHGMKLRADLVVLSACHTGSGKEVKGEGVMGLNTAFLHSGAKSVISSLWAVDDSATNVLMREFYRGLADGEHVSAALRNAQLKLYRDPQFRSPFYWGAFTLQGNIDTRPVIGKSSSIVWLLVPLVAVGLAVMIVAISRRWRTRRP